MRKIFFLIMCASQKVRNLTFDLRKTQFARHFVFGRPVLDSLQNHFLNQTSLDIKKGKIDFLKSRVYCITK